MTPQVLTIEGTDGKSRLDIDPRAIRTVGVRVKRDGSSRAYFDLDEQACPPPTAVNHGDGDLAWTVSFMPPEQRGACSNARHRAAEEDD